MTIDFKLLKEAWKDWCGKGIPLPPAADSADFEKSMRKYSSRFLYLDIIRAGVGILGVILLLFLILGPFRHRVLDAATITSVGILLLMSIDTIRLILKCRDPHYDRSRIQFLLRQKSITEARIWFQRRLNLFALLLLASMVFHARAWLLALLIYAALWCFLYFNYSRRIMRTRLQPCLDALNKRLHEYQEIESEA